MSTYNDEFTAYIEARIDKAEENKLNAWRNGQRLDYLHHYAQRNEAKWILLKYREIKAREEKMFTKAEFLGIVENAIREVMMPREERK